MTLRKDIITLMKNDFTFLLVNYKNRKRTLLCISSIHKQLSSSPLKVQIFIFDNSPKTSNFGPNVKTFGTGQNIGFAKACNFLASQAAKSSQNLIFLNNDTVLEPKFIKNLSKISNSLKSNTAICPLILDSQRNVWFSGGTFRALICRPETSQTLINRPVKSTILTGCCIIVSAKNWKKSGGFDENFFLYYEDIDWSIRSSGWMELIVDPNLKITHFVHSSAGHNNGPVQAYFQTRNNLYLAKKLRRLPTNIPYMFLITIKRLINLATKPSPQKKLTLRMIFIAWKDFITNNYGQKSFF